LEYVPVNPGPNFTPGGITNNPANCPAGTVAEGPFRCNGDFNSDNIECWLCRIYRGPWHDITMADLPVGSPLYWARCEPLGGDYLQPFVFESGKCAGECCDLNTKSCNNLLGCVPRA
jgi:hypothetical protein